MDAGSGKIIAPPDGYQRLSKKLAASYGLSYRQLYDRIRSGGVVGAVQDEGGGWYLPPDIGIARVRAKITPEVEERILEALRAGRKPAAVARRERVGESTVYALKERHYRALAEDERQRREKREHLKQMLADNPSKVSVLHRGAGAENNTPIVATDLKAADQEVLEQLVKFEGYFDPSRNTFYVTPEQVREIVEWENAREERLEELYRRAT